MGTVIKHPQVEADKAAVEQVREMIAAGPALVLGPEGRAAFDKQLEAKQAAPGVTYEDAKVGGVPGVWCKPANADRGTAILYFHGGAYVEGSAKAFRNYVGQIASRANAATFAVDYRLAPEYPYPAAVDDALAAYAGLAERSRSIVIAGDSAGGGLALVTLAMEPALPLLGSTIPLGACSRVPERRFREGIVERLAGRAARCFARRELGLQRRALDVAQRIVVDDHQRGQLGEPGLRAFENAPRDAHHIEGSRRPAMWAIIWADSGSLVPTFSRVRMMWQCSSL